MSNRTGMELDDLDGDPAIVLPWHPAPDEEDAIYALGKLTEQIANILLAQGKHPNLVETSAYQITQTWTNAMKTT